MIIRLLDIVFSAIGLIISLPLFIIVYLVIICESNGGGVYKQERIGKYHKPFYLYKFRTMFVDSDKGDLITIGNKDSRITKAGAFLRKYKIDELPQLFNVLKGDMSIVGPRPEVKKYVDLYTDEQQKVLTIRPGITDYASIKYSNENEILGKAEDPHQLYIEVIMPDKIMLNMKYIDNYSVTEYFKIIFLTMFKIVDKR